VDNASVAEHQDCQRQKVGDDQREKSNALLHGIASVDAERYAGFLHDVRSHSGERDLNCRNDDPDECDCSIHETLFDLQLQNAQFSQFVW